MSICKCACTNQIKQKIESICKEHNFYFREDMGGIIILNQFYPHWPVERCVICYGLHDALRTLIGWVPSGPTWEEIELIRLCNKYNFYCEPLPCGNVLLHKDGPDANTHTCIIDTSIDNALATIREWIENGENK